MKSNEAFWDVEHGNTRLLSEMSPMVVKTVISPMLESGEMVGQFMFPFQGEPPDMALTIPHKTQERNQAIEARLVQVRKELLAMAHIPKG